MTFEGASRIITKVQKEEGYPPHLVYHDTQVRYRKIRAVSILVSLLKRLMVTGYFADASERPLFCDKDGQCREVC